MRTKLRTAPGLQQLLSLGRPLVVGTLHEASGVRLLGELARRPSCGVDILEARLDLLQGRALPEKLPLPVIATARHPAEGGSGNLSLTRRRNLLREAIPWASAVDIELRSAGTLSPLIAEAHQHGRTVILSHHDFSATPSLAVLEKLSSKAVDAGADLFKVAVMIRDQRDFRRLIDFQMMAAKLPVTAMGMGPAGRFSRLVLCGFGAALCYGWLGKPQIPGQWPAIGLRGLLDKILPV